MRIPKLKAKTVVYLGVLTAVEIVLSRFLSISAWNLKIGLGFLPVVMAALLFGPLAGGLVAALGDFIGALLFPVGPYFPGFTLTAFLTGLTFGLFLRKKRSFWRVLGAVCVVQLPLGLGLNTLWISVLYNAPFRALLATRAVQCAVLIPVQLIVTLLLCRAMERRKFL